MGLKQTFHWFHPESHFAQRSKFLGIHQCHTTPDTAPTRRGCDMCSHCQSVGWSIHTVPTFLWCCRGMVASCRSWSRRDMQILREYRGWIPQMSRIQSWSSYYCPLMDKMCSWRRHILTRGNTLILRRFFEFGKLYPLRRYTGCIRCGRRSCT